MSWIDRFRGCGPYEIAKLLGPVREKMRRALARDFTVVCADLRGYGRSGCLSSAPDHAPYAKRAMALSVRQFSRAKSLV
jgi:pimeloyl-ACP methyl ester carboxylesterase